MLGIVTQLHLGLVPWAGNTGQRCSVSHEGNLLGQYVGLGISSRVWVCNCGSVPSDLALGMSVCLERGDNNSSLWREEPWESHSHYFKWWSLSWPPCLVKFPQAPGEKSGPTAKHWKSAACLLHFFILLKIWGLTWDHGFVYLLRFRGQLHFIDCRESLLPFMDAIHSQIFRWDDEEMSGYPFLCQSQKPLPNTALADTGRLLARQTLVCVSHSSKYLHLIPKGSID